MSELAPAANDPSKRPPELTPEHIERLRRAYGRTQFEQNGVSFDDALATTAYRIALERIADLSDGIGRARR